MDDDWRVLAHGETLLELGRAPEAAERFGEVLAREPDSVRGLVGLAMALSMQDRLAEAEQAVRQAVQLDPDDVDVLHVLTGVLLSGEDHESALEVAERAVSIDPDAWISHYNHARALLRGTRRQAWPAADAGRRAVELAPFSPDTHNVLGLCLGKLSDHSGAEKEFRKALEIDPGHSHAQRNLAALHLDRMELLTGAETLTRGLASNPFHTGMHHEVRRAQGRLLGIQATCVALFAVLLGGTIERDPYSSRVFIGLFAAVTATGYVIKAQRRWSRGTWVGLLPWRAGLRPWVWIAWWMNALSALVFFAPASVARVSWWVLAFCAGSLALLMVVAVIIGGPPKPPEG